MLVVLTRIGKVIIVPLLGIYFYSCPKRKKNSDV